MVGKSDGRKAIKKADNIILDNNQLVDDLSDDLQIRLKHIIDKWNIEEFGSWKLFEDWLEKTTKYLELLGTSYESELIETIPAAIDPIIDALNANRRGLLGAFLQVKDNLDNALVDVRTGVIDIADYQADKEAKAWDDIRLNFESTQDLAYDQFLNTFDEMTLGITGIADGMVKGIGDAFKPSDTGQFPLIDYFTSALKNIFAFDEGLLTDMFDSMTKISDKRQKEYLKDHIDDIGMKFKE